MKTIVAQVYSMLGLFRGVCQALGAMRVAPSQGQLQAILFIAGIGILFAGTLDDAVSQITVGVIGGGTDWEEHDAIYNETAIAQAVNILLTYLEGSFGSLVMVGAGIAAILSSAFGQYRASLNCLVVAIGAFILRSVMATFFNMEWRDTMNAGS